MTIVVSVRVTDGIVLASDSATTLSDSLGNVVKVYDNANKLFNLVKGLPIGAMTFGSGSIGSASISTLTKDLRKLLDPVTGTDPRFVLDENTFSIEGVAEKARDFFTEKFALEHPHGVPNFFMGYIVAGYSAGSALPEAWQFFVAGPQPQAPMNLYPGDSFGARWQGMTDALDRVVLGASRKLVDVFKKNGMTDVQAEAAYTSIIMETNATLCSPAMPIQDAIDLTQFLAETAVKFARFSPNAATVGGPIDIAAITKHEGFRWTKRKYFFTKDLN